MKFFKWMISVLIAAMVLVIVFLTSTEYAIFSNRSFYAKEYTKYNVAEEVDMELSELMNVTNVMLEYLKDNVDDLDVVTIVDGHEREFFNERERLHMEDVKEIFDDAFFIRRVFVCTIAAFLIGLMILKTKITYMLPRAILGVSAVSAIIFGALALIVSTNFTKYFTVFHEIFFDNDLWLLDPNTDLLINIVPEPFFMDMSVRIFSAFGVAMAVLLCICFVFIKTDRRKQ